MTISNQDFITVCIPFASASDWAELRVQEVEAMIDRLGNPVNEDVARSLDHLGIVHFLSANVLPVHEVDKKAFFILEATVDGDAEQALLKIGKALTDHLFPILARACDLRHPFDLPQFLLKHHYRMRQSNLYNKMSGITGMPFNGKTGLTVSGILRNRLVVNKLREKMESQEPKDTLGPIFRFSELKEFAESDCEVRKLLAPNGSSFDDEIAEDLTFADHKSAPWLIHKSTNQKAMFTRILPLISTELKLSLTAFFSATFLAIGYGLNLDLVVRPITVLRNWLAGAGLDLEGTPLKELVWSFLCPESSCAPGSIFFYYFSQLIILFNTMALAGAASVVLLAIGFYFAYRRLRWSETGSVENERQTIDPKRNYPLDLDPDPAIVSEIMKRENNDDYVQNHMFHAAPMVAGKFRRITLRLAFRVIDRGLSGGLIRPGFLAGVGTAHAVRWFIPPRSNRLVFCGNYDGNWESYLEGFITKAPGGTTAIWSNCQGFPRTRNLFQEGATDGDRLKRYARRTMLPSRCWYSAYPDLTAEQIRKHALIHDGLCRIGKNDSSSAQAWLNLFDSVPRPDPMLEHDNIQSIAYGNQRHLDRAMCIVVNFRDTERQSIKSCLAKEIISEITFGVRKPAEEATYIAFTASGLRKIGLEELFDAPANGTGAHNSVPSEFAPAFAMGMGNSERQRLLKDPDPQDWLWGHGEKTADMTLLLYWDSKCKTSAETMCKNWCEKLSPYGLEIVHHVDISDHSKMANKSKEPFGFEDGVSQPIVRGLVKQGNRKESIHNVEPGEFILGYKDNRGYYPPTPQVQLSKNSKDRVTGYLPALPEDMPRRYPSFSNQTNLRDFGRNGSYLVIRQIQQNVEEFNKFCNKTAIDLNLKSPGTSGAEMIGAMLIGRWKNGNALINHPDDKDSVPVVGPENEFLYGEQDPQGFRCPLGAHIRRANPRDSLDPGNEEELSVSNRHRILRRGRTYWKENSDNTEDGLLFMCLNSDIERQFEFVQSTWLNSSSFHGLEGEQDPILSTKLVNKYSAPKNVRTKTISGFSQFTKLLGGDYFFLPGRQALNFLIAEPENPVNSQEAADDIPPNMTPLI